MQGHKFTIGLALLISSLVGLTACGPRPPEKVEITLKEFGIETSRTDFNTGQPYEFVVTNEGQLAHELMIVPPTDTGMSMPGMSMGQSDTTMSELDSNALAMVSEDQLQPGQTATITVTFDKAASPGSLEFACHVSGHYEQNMRIPITVRP